MRAYRTNIHPDTLALFKKDDVEKNRPRTPDHQQSSCKCRRTPPVTGMHAPTGPASDSEPVHPPAPEVRGMDQHGAWGRGGARRRGCLRTPPRPGLHAGGGVEVRDHGSARGRAGTSPGALAGWLLMVEGSWVVCAAGASPLHPP